MVCYVCPVTRLRPRVSRAWGYRTGRTFGRGLLISQAIQNPKFHEPSERRTRTAGQGRPEVACAHSSVCIHCPAGEPPAVVVFTSSFDMSMALALSHGGHPGGEGPHRITLPGHIVIIFIINGWLFYCESLAHSHYSA